MVLKVRVNPNGETLPVIPAGTIIPRVTEPSNGYWFFIFRQSNTKSRIIEAEALLVMRAEAGVWTMVGSALLLSYISNPKQCRKTETSSLGTD